MIGTEETEDKRNQYKGTIYMDINSICSDRNLLLQFSGELDHNGAKEAIREMEYALDAALPKKLVLDFTGITFMDSSGIALILRAKRRMEFLGGGVYICHIPQQARRVLNTAGIGHLVTIQEEHADDRAPGKEGQA